MPRYKVMLTLRKIIYVRALTEKKSVVMGVMKKKLSIFMFQLPIYYKLE